MVQRSYLEFISEKMENDLLELLNESLFIMSSKMGEIINDLYNDDEDYSKIAKCFYIMDMEDVDTSVSYLDLGDDNSSITFLNPDKMQKIRYEKGWTISDIYKNVKGNAIKVGRLTKKVIEIYNKSNNKDLKFTDKEIEKFVNAYKAQYDFTNNAMDNFNLLSKDDDIKWAYLEDNYFNEDGTLGGSCMRYEDAQYYFDLYTETSVNILVFSAPNKKVMGRAVIWTLTDGRKFMDRVYTNRDSDVDLFIKYAKENKFIYKKCQNSTADTTFYTPEDDYYKDIPLNLESKVQKFNLNYREDQSFPYMDTMKFLYWREGVIRNRDYGYSSYYVQLEDTDGWCDCHGCGNDGKVECSDCDGRGQQECSSCDGQGWTNCGDCDGQGSITCSNCSGGMVEGVDGEETECPDCSGNGYNDCDKCSSSGHIDCDDCNSNGSVDCETCDSEGSKSCDKCGGYSDKYSY